MGVKQSTRDAIAIAGIVILVLVGIVTLILVAAGVTIFSTKVSAYTAKKTLANREVTQVFNPTNALESQAYFESLRANFNGFLVKIVVQKTVVAGDNSPYNQANLAGMRQECIDAAQSYNAAALSISSEAFRTVDLPYQLNAARCAG